MIFHLLFISISNISLLINKNIKLVNDDSWKFKIKDVIEILNVFFWHKKGRIILLKEKVI